MDVTSYHPTKRRPLKKRHTKPCKFYALSKCPKSAEECDFLHGIAPKPPPRESKLCRYFLAGHCSKGLECPFKHMGESLDDELDDEETFVEHDEGSDSESDLSTKIVATQWPSFGGSHLSPVARHKTLSPSSTSSRSSSVSSDRTLPPVLNVTTEFAHPLPHTHAQSYDASYIVPTSPIQQTPFYHAFARRQMALEKKIANRPGTKISKSKMASYKTKPCRYYVLGSPKSCPSGSHCTFIHDPSEEAIKHSEEVQKHGLPHKPLSPLEESRKNGFYPITWRVIGGGVLMGTTGSVNVSSARKDNRKYGQDAREPDASFEIGAELPDGGLQEEFGLSSRRSRVPRALADLEGLGIWVEERGRRGSRELSPSRTPRARATSIPPTPSATHFEVERLFSAESPACL